VFELLKEHLCLEVSAIAMIDLDQDIKGSQIRFHQSMPGAIAVFLYPIAQQLFLQAQVHRFIVPRARGCHVLHASFFLKVLPGLR
jgi:hypothetical protein